MILELRSKETDELIEDGFIEVDDEIMLQLFTMASEANMTFNDWFNQMLSNFIKKYEQYPDKFLNDISDYEV